MEILRGVVRSWTRQAIVADGTTFRFGPLAAAALSLADQLSNSPTRSPSSRGSEYGARVAIMAPPGQAYVQSTWATWLAGGIAVPLCLSHPPRELQYVLEDAQVSTVLATRKFRTTMAPLAAAAGCTLIDVPASDCSASAEDQQQLQDRLTTLQHGQGALMMYTSGTTGRPKGVLHTHRSVDAIVQALCSAWDWRASDRILHALPLHHMHGVANALYCAHAAGACVEFLPSFSPSAVWQALKRRENPITVFMGVPTMYDYLLTAYDKMDGGEQQQAREAAQRLRLTVCGSSACPLHLMERWRSLSGQTLLERYGMTETGMILSNPLHGERRPGFVGLPLPGVQVQSAPVGGQNDESASSGARQAEGELLVAGDAVFAEYWNRPDATAEAFDASGFFRTGDTAALEGDPPYWRILGRTSVDILKSGGYKISALGIEDVLHTHPAVAECAVVGVPDSSLGDAVAAVIACRPGKGISLEELQEYAKQHLPPYQVPRKAKFVEEIPRNAMGKVNKKQLVKDMFPDEA